MQRKLFSNFGNDIVSTIEKAGREKRVLNITYRDSKGEITTRDTEPYEIKDGAYWGYSVDKGQIRRFSLQNILSAKITERLYSPRWEVKF